MDAVVLRKQNETNFKIQPVENGGFVVRSDSERFGDNEIVFQGISYDEYVTPPVFIQSKKGLSL